MLYENLFLFFPPLYNYLKPFLKFQPPRLVTFGIFFNPCLLGPPIYLALESSSWYFGIRYIFRIGDYPYKLQAKIAYFERISYTLFHKHTGKQGLSSIC